jgi:hypothetical protein
MNTYKNDEGENKHMARTLMVQSIQNSETKNFKILSLPCDKFQIEKRIYQKVSRRYNYVMVERDDETFDKLKRNLKKQSDRVFMGRFPSLYFGSIGDIIFNSRENEYSHMILDYCGQIGTFHRELEYVFRNDIVEVGGTISMTFNKRISIGESTIFCNKMDRLVSHQIPEENDNKKTMRVVNNFFIKECGYKYDIETIFEYLDNSPESKGSPMVLVICRRLK